MKYLVNIIYRPPIFVTYISNWMEKQLQTEKERTQSPQCNVDPVAVRLNSDIS